MEFLRFGSSIPGTYWGCCACCIIQNFKVDPEAKASIQIVEGDGGTPYNPNKFAGTTYREIFEQRLRYGTFSTREMPDHAFIAILSKTQVDSSIGKAWLKILKAHGFEFLRTVNNSVWGVHNYIFILVRNVSGKAVADQFTPPSAWTDLPSVVPEPWEYLSAEPQAAPHRGSLTYLIKAKQQTLYAALPPVKFYSEEELVAAGIPVSYAGKRSHQHGSFAVGYPQQTKAQREKFESAFAALTDKEKKETPSIRAAIPATPVVG